jgi:hypothetical protein
MAMAMGAMPRATVERMTKRRIRQSSRQFRSPREWALRIASALVVGVAGYFSVAHSLAYTTRRASPELAYTLAPWDGRIAASFSEQLSGPDATPYQRMKSEHLASYALVRDPTAVEAVATLGINAHLRNDPSVARRFFTYSDRLSRRDLRTRLWAIEDAVARNDIPDVLRNYDIALRTSSYASGILYPVLGTAISNVDIRNQVARVLATKPSWGEGFLAYIASTAKNADATADLFIRLKQQGTAVAPYVSTLVVERLIAIGDVDKAWRYYAYLVPGSDRQHVRDPEFKQVNDRPTAFDWVPVVNDTGISASIQATENSGLFDFAASSTAGGEVLRQMQVLTPGTYLLEGISRNIEQQAISRPYWVLTCASGEELGRINLPNSAMSGGRFSGLVKVPSECAVQYLKLIVRPSNEVGGVTGQIDRLSLRLAD